MTTGSTEEHYDRRHSRHAEHPEQLFQRTVLTDEVIPNPGQRAEERAVNQGRRPAGLWRISPCDIVSVRSSVIQPEVDSSNMHCVSPCCGVQILEDARVYRPVRACRLTERRHR